VESTQQIRDNIGSVLEGKVEARALTQQTRIEIVDLDEMVTAKDLQNALSEQIGISLDATAIKSLRPAFGGTQRATITLSAAHAKKTLTAGKVKIAWSICRIRESNAPLKCYKCLEFGHIAANCSSSEDRSGCCYYQMDAASLVLLMT